MQINNDNAHAKALAIIEFFFDNADEGKTFEQCYVILVDEIEKLADEVVRYEQHRWPI